MKKLLLLLLAGFPALTNAQIFSASPNDTLETTNSVNDFLSDYIYIHNNSLAAIDLSFQTISNTMDNAGWDPLLCTNVGCSPYLPMSGSLGTISSGDDAYLNLHIGFQGIAGTGKVQFKVFETGNSLNADTITFIYHAVATTGLTTHNNSEAFYLSQNFPNPFTTSSTISYRLPTNYGSLQIFDVTGKLLRIKMLDKNQGTIGIDQQLNKGIYFCTLFDANGTTLATRKLTVL